MIKVAISKLRPGQPLDSTFQVDRYFENLYNSISIWGIIEPLLISRINDKFYSYRVNSGNLRLSIAGLLGFSEVPCLILNPIKISGGYSIYPREISNPNDLGISIISKSLLRDASPLFSNSCDQKQKNYNHPNELRIFRMIGINTNDDCNVKLYLSNRGASADFLMNNKIRGPDSIIAYGFWI